MEKPSRSAAPEVGAAVCMAATTLGRVEMAPRRIPLPLGLSLCRSGDYFLVFLHAGSCRDEGVVLGMDRIHLTA